MKRPRIPKNKKATRYYNTIPENVVYTSEMILGFMDHTVKPKRTIEVEGRKIVIESHNEPGSMGYGPRYR